MIKSPKPLALDLFCGGGGAALGMQWAGFEVVGIDIKEHRNYPGHFIQGDALNPPVNIEDFDFVWASPPCQKFSTSLNHSNKSRADHPNLIPQTRRILKGHTYTVIENVPQAPLRHDLYLWGPQFGLTKLWRKRVFELSFWCWGLPRPKMIRGQYCSIVGGLGASHFFYRRKAEGKPGTLSKNEAKCIMGIPLCKKMTKREIVESVPPFYAEYIAKEVMRQIVKKC